MNASIATADERRDTRLRGMLARMSADERAALAGMVRASVDVAGRVPPHNAEAEAAVISTMLTDNRRIAEVLEIVPSGEAFYGEANGTIFDVAAELHARGTPVDIETVRDVLVQRDKMQAVGGIAYIASIVDATPSVANVAAHAMIVREKHRVRMAAAACSMIAAEAHGDYGTSSAFLAGAAE